MGLDTREPRATVTGTRSPTLFTEDARYYTSPDAEAEVGHAAIRALWLRDKVTLSVCERRFDNPCTATTRPAAGD
jgi:hypothetical protein